MSTPDEPARRRRSTSDVLPKAVADGADGKVTGGDDRGGWQRGFANAWMVLGAAPAGLFIGYFIDRAYGTAPWWMLGLSLLFLAVSLYQLVKDAWK